MSFVLDTDTCSAYFKGNARVSSRFMQYGGGLYISAVTAAELYTWAYRGKSATALLQGIADMLNDVSLLPVDLSVAQEFGALRARLLDREIVVAIPDLLIAATALLFDFTIVTHNIRHFSMVPGVRVQDWLVP